jgi:hypothetical protein
MEGAAMYTIPLIDIRKSSPVELVRSHAEQARALIAASCDTLGLVSQILGALVLPTGDRLSREWLERTNNPYLREIRDYAEILGVPGVYALNLCYEWSCTSGAYKKGEGVLLARVLDWSFPAMGENILVSHQSGEAGDFYNVTWPGTSGVFSAMAPGRFAVALNQAPMRSHGLGFVFDWAKNRMALLETTGAPPAHLLRKVFETASDYREARRLLASAEIALPVIYTVTGTKDDEGCVIERTEKECVVRELESGRVCAANHFESSLEEAGHGWRPRPIDSFGRMRLARSTPEDEIDENFRWFKSPIANPHSRLVMLADAASGRLSVLGVLGDKPVSNVFRL